jgi:RNA polymerase sigma-70 factor (ECF subfamily)
MAVLNERDRETKLAGRADPAQEFLALLEPIKATIERYALRSAWNREQGRDIVQEAVMTAWREFHRFEQGTDFRAWVFRILINTIYSFNKKTSRDRKHGSTLPIESLDGVLERESAWASVLEEPAKILESLDDRLAGAIGELRNDERQCLLLRLVEGVSYKQIAVLLSMPMGTVMSHVHRARMKLRERLADLAVEQRLVRDTP